MGSSVDIKSIVIIVLY